MSGHGHVTPNPDGSKARCGGVGICRECSVEAAMKQALDRERARHEPEDHSAQLKALRTQLVEVQATLDRVRADRDALREQVDGLHKARVMEQERADALQVEAKRLRMYADLVDPMTRKALRYLLQLRRTRDRIHSDICGEVCSVDCAEASRVMADEEQDETKVGGQ